jgi:hypothetical protein
MTDLFELLDTVERNREVVVRDDQYEFPALLDAAAKAVSRNTRFVLLDTGRFSLPELEWLGQSGVQIYTSDEARPDLQGLLTLQKACLQGSSFLVLLIRGQIPSEPRDGVFSASSLKELGLDGVILHVSDRDAVRDPVVLSEIAADARTGGGFLVYYRHGGSFSGLEELAAAGAYLHISDKFLEESDLEILMKFGERLVLYVERGMTVDALRKAFDEGAVLLFKTPPADDGSKLHHLEEKARRRNLDPRSYYLYTTFLL